MYVCQQSTWLKVYVCGTLQCYHNVCGGKSLKSCLVIILVIRHSPPGMPCGHFCLRFRTPGTFFEKQNFAVKKNLGIFRPEGVQALSSSVMQCHDVSV